jgi:hypothetical protein
VDEFMLQLQNNIRYLPIILGESKRGKVIPLHAMEALGVRGGIAPTHS